MDYKQFNEIVDKIRLTRELANMNHEIYMLRKYLYTLSVLRNKFAKGAITEGVNISIEPLNRKYGTTFKCEKDDDFVEALTSMIKYIDEKAVQTIQKSIEEKIAKKMLNS